MSAAQKDISVVHLSSVRPVLKSDQITANGSVAAATYTEAQSIDSFETYLLANGYAQAKLDQMTKNDKEYAYRLKKGATVAP